MVQIVENKCLPRHGCPDAYFFASNGKRGMRNFWCQYRRSSKHLFTYSICSVAKQQKGYQHGGQGNRDIVIYNISYRNTLHHSGCQRNENEFTNRLIPADLNVTKPREIGQHPSTRKQREYISNACEILSRQQECAARTIQCR